MQVSDILSDEFSVEWGVSATAPPPRKRQKTSPEDSELTFSCGDSVRQYTIQNTIGQGSFGRVYEATYPGTSTEPGGKVALKVSKRALNSADRELEVLTHLKTSTTSKYVLQMREEFVWLSDSMLHHQCLVFPFYGSVSLSDRIYNSTGCPGWAPLQLHEVSALGRQLLCGLSHLKSLGVIHRDIKPPNIMMHSGTPVIIDVGSSFLLNQDWEPCEKNVYCVTRWYRAPELAQRFRTDFDDNDPPPEIRVTGDYDTRVDLWSLACVLGECANRQVLLLGGNNLRQMEAIVRMCGMPSPRMVGAHDFYFNADCSPKNADWAQNPDALEDACRTMTTDWERVAAADVPDRSAQFKNLLAAMLRYDPETRLSLEDTQRHGFFA